MAERPWKFESSRPHHLIHRRGIGASPADGGGSSDATRRRSASSASSMCVALVVGNMVGSGVFLLPADLAPLGWNSVYGWLVTIAGTLCLAVVLARLARDARGRLRPFTYPAAAFGPGAGFIVAWSYWISIWVTNATLAVAVVSNLSIIWPGLGAPGRRRRGRDRRGLAVHHRQLPGRPHRRRRAGADHPAQAAAAGRRDPGRRLAARQRRRGGRRPRRRCRSAWRASAPPRPSPCSPCSASKARWRRATGSRIRSATCRAPPSSAPRSPASSICSPARR